MAITETFHRRVCDFCGMKSHELKKITDVPKGWVRTRVFARYGTSVYYFCMKFHRDEWRKTRLEAKKERLRDEW